MYNRIESVARDMITILARDEANKWRNEHDIRNAIRDLAREVVTYGTRPELVIDIVTDALADVVSRRAK